MIAVDTNILARFYCDDPDDPEAAKQRPQARDIMITSPAVFVPQTVVLEFKWVMRGFYEQTPETFCQAMEHLLGMPQVTVDRSEETREALNLHRQGFDFADALHWVSSKMCTHFFTFDDRRFARRASRLEMQPNVMVPTSISPPSRP